MQMIMINTATANYNEAITDIYLLCYIDSAYDNAEPSSRSCSLFSLDEQESS